MATTISIEDIRTGLHTLPQELFDVIGDFVLEGTVLTEWERFPAQLHLNRKTRAHYLKLLEHSSDEIVQPFEECDKAIELQCEKTTNCQRFRSWYPPWNFRGVDESTECYHVHTDLYNALAARLTPMLPFSAFEAFMRLKDTENRLLGQLESYHRFARDLPVSITLYKGARKGGTRMKPRDPISWSLFSKRVVNNQTARKKHILANGSMVAPGRK